MRTKRLLALLFFTLSCSATTLHAGTPEQEKAFTDKYKTAYEAKDTATLESFLYTKDANPMALEFYKMMVSNGAGGKVSKIELVDPEIKKAIDDRNKALEAAPSGSAAKPAETTPTPTP